MKRENVTTILGDGAKELYNGALLGLGSTTLIVPLCLAGVFKGCAVLAQKLHYSERVEKVSYAIFHKSASYIESVNNGMGLSIDPVGKSQDTTKLIGGMFGVFAPLLTGEFLADSIIGPAPSHGPIHDKGQGNCDVAPAPAKAMENHIENTIQDIQKNTGVTFVVPQMK